VRERVSVCVRVCARARACLCICTMRIRFRKTDKSKRYLKASVNCKSNLSIFSKFDYISIFNFLKLSDAWYQLFDDSSEKNLK